MAGSKIRGITIDIGADTSKFTSALKETNSAITSTSKQLKDVNKLLKLDPTNTNLLTQKQQLLGKQITDTKSKLEQLKLTQQAMADSGVDTTSDQYMALEREIASTEDSLKSLEKEQTNFGSVASQTLQGVGQELKDLGSKISDVGSTLTKKVTTPLAAFGGTAIAAFTQYDSGADTIIQKTGATGEALEAMQESMENIASSIPTSFETAGSAIGEVNTRFEVTGEELEKLATQFIEFAELNGTDVSTSIDNVQKAMAAFGVDTQDCGAMLDTLNKVGQETGISVDTLASSMTTNAQSLKEMGLSASDAATLLGTLEKSGIDTNTVMTGMKKVLTEAYSEGTTSQEAFAKALESNESAIDVFGSRAGAVLKSAFDDGTLSIDMFTGGLTSLQDNLGSVEDTYNETLDPIDTFKTTMNECIPVLADVGNNIMEVLAPILEKLCGIVENVTNWWESLDSGTQDLIVTIGLIVAALGPVISIIGTIVSGVGSVISVIGFLTSPIGLVVAAIAAVIAIIIVCIQHWDEIKEVASNCWEGIKEVWSVVADWFSELFSKIKEVGTNIWNGIKDLVVGVWNGIKSVWSGVGDFFSNVWNGIVNTVKSIKDKILAPFKAAWEGIKSLFSGTIELPKIKLPHFSVSGSLNPLNWLKQGLPSISIEWYKQAMNQPYTFNSPTLIGVGEAGSETVVGTEWLKNHTGSSTTNNITIYQQAGEDVNALVSRIEQRLTKNMRRANSW